MSKAAIDFIRRAKQEGCTPNLQGVWLSWSPPLPPELATEILDRELSNAVWELLMNKRWNKHENFL